MIFPVILPQRLWTPGWTGPLYAVHGSALTRVTATFRVPIPQTPAKANAQVDVWAGLGGLHHANNLCQAGITLQNTSQGVRGFLWAYDYPAAHREILGVQPGQTIGWLPVTSAIDGRLSRRMPRPTSLWALAVPRQAGAAGPTLRGLPRRMPGIGPRRF